MSEKPKVIGWFIEKYWKSNKTWVFYDFHIRKPESHRQLAELLNPHEPNAKYRWCPAVDGTDLIEKGSEQIERPEPSEPDYVKEDSNPGKRKCLNQ